MTDIIIDDDVMTNEELKFVDDNIISTKSMFPFYKGNSTKDAFIMSHYFVDRNNQNIITQDYYHFFQNILVRFCDKHSISIERVYRSVLNVGTENSFHKQTHPHIDLFRDGYKIGIIYLNDVSNDSGYNSTIVYKERAIKSEENVLDFSKLKDLTIEKEVEAKRGRIVCFDGMRYHANYFSKGNEYRYVVVFNFS